MIRPLQDRIVVRPDAENKLSEVLVVMARQGMHDSQKQLGRTGTVLATGPGKKDKKGKVKPLSVMPHDRIAFGEFAYPAHTQQDGEKVLLLQEGDVIGIISSN